jgi:hypothetical protein
MVICVVGNDGSETVNMGMTEAEMKTLADASKMNWDASSSCLDWKSIKLYSDETCAK